MNYIDNLLSTNEHIIRQHRQHPARLTTGLFGLLRSLIVVILLYFIVRSFTNFRRNQLAPSELTTELDGIITPFTDLIPFELPTDWISWLIGLFILLAIFRYVQTVIYWLTAQDILTNRRVIQVRGVFSKHTSDTSLDKINDVHLMQSWLGRMLGYGHLTIMTANQIGISMLFYLPDPIEFKKEMLNARDALTQNSTSHHSPREGNFTAGASPNTQDTATRLANLDSLYQQNLLTPEEYQERRQRILNEL